MRDIFVFTFIFKILILFQLHHHAEARRLDFTAATSNFSSKYFSNFTIHVANSSLYLEADLIKPLVAGLKAKVDFQIRLANSKNYQTLFGYNFDVCNMALSVKNTLYRRWYESVTKRGNFMQECPVYEDHYYLNGWRMESSLIPNYLFAGDYRSTAYIYLGKNKKLKWDFIANISIDASIV